MSSRSDPEYMKHYMRTRRAVSRDRKVQRTDDRLNMEMWRHSQAIGPRYFLLGCLSKEKPREMVRPTLESKDLLDILRTISPLMTTALERAFTTSGDLIDPGPRIIKRGGPHRLARIFYLITPGSQKGRFVIHIIPAIDREALARITPQEELHQACEPTMEDGRWHEATLTGNPEPMDESALSAFRCILWCPPRDFVSMVFEGMPAAAARVKKRLAEMKDTLNFIAAVRGLSPFPDVDLRLVADFHIPDPSKLSATTNTKRRGRHRKFLKDS